MWRNVFCWSVIALSVAAYAFAGWGVSAAYWYHPVLVQIDDVDAGGDPLVKISREIHRDFRGEYTVSVWRQPSDGHVTCAGSDRISYRGGLYQPHQDLLSHWADDPECARLRPGNYFAQACWTILRPFGGLVPEKTTCIMSNVFAVRPAV